MSCPAKPRGLVLELGVRLVLANPEDLLPIQAAPWSEFEKICGIISSTKGLDSVILSFIRRSGLAFPRTDLLVATGE